MKLWEAPCLMGSNGSNAYFFFPHLPMDGAK